MGCFAYIYKYIYIKKHFVHLERDREFPSKPILLLLLYCASCVCLIRVTAVWHFFFLQKYVYIFLWGDVRLLAPPLFKCQPSLVRKKGSPLPWKAYRAGQELSADRRQKGCQRKRMPPPAGSSTTQQQRTPSDSGVCLCVFFLFFFGHFHTRQTYHSYRSHQILFHGSASSVQISTGVNLHAGSE